MNNREAMDAELKRTVVPALREKGFGGSFPHFRRISATGIDLLSFQFDKWGGGFVIEIARCAKEGLTTYWGKQILPQRVNAHDVDPDQRHRIQPRVGGGADSWFRFDTQSPENVAREVLQKLPVAEAWWRSHA